LYDWPALKAAPRAVVDVDPGLLEELAGRYEIPGEIVVTLEVVDGELWAEIPDQSRQQLLPMSETVFFSRLDGGELTFIRENGRVVAFSVGNTRVERVR
jgi:hypothetical protein